MTKIDFSMELNSSSEKILSLISDYEQYPSYLPKQIKKVVVIEKNTDQTTTNELFFFKTLFNKEVKQQSIHKKISDNCISTVIMSGPIKDSVITVCCEKTSNGTSVKIEGNIKTSLKYKFFEPLITKMYKSIIRGILYQMNNRAV